jgi:membrane associated rhomboid family serine protease
VPATLIEIFRSPHRSECDERALVLVAVGIAAVIGFDGLDFVLQVDEADVAAALAQLRQYAAESRPAPLPPPPPPSHRGAWVGCALYVLVLLTVAYSIGNGLWRLDAFSTGELDSARVQAGQWWRAWTALTLHVDAAHLAANLGAGVWFGYLAGRELGTGTAWLLSVSGAALANLFEALLGPADHISVGASTAVFTALGLLSAHAWRLRRSYAQPWARRWAPLVGGVVLLGWLGSSGEGVDVVSHALGFLIGAGLGTLAAAPPIARALRHVPQWLAGAVALGSVALAWGCALARG